MFPTPFHIIAHRGASARAPENTPPAFERAATPDGAPPRGRRLELQNRVAIQSIDLSPEVLAYARERGLIVHEWGIRSDEDMERAMRPGAMG